MEKPPPTLLALAIVAAASSWGCDTGAARSTAVDPCALALAPAGARKTAAIDAEIASLREKAGDPAALPQAMARLGWKLVARARSGFNPGDYRLAECCALCLESKEPGSPEALLLRGHALHSLHRFQEAERVARELVAKRGEPADHGLLGDSLLEQGRLDEAAAEYQEMLDQRPGLHSYARAAQLRWLKGDLAGALEVMRMAVAAGSARDPESLAWARTRLAMLGLEAGSVTDARRDCDAALRLEPDHAPALVAKARTMLAGEIGEWSGAIELLQRACELNPLPEPLWLLADALHAVRREDEARRIEARLLQSGPAADPRSASLFLATRGVEVEKALALAREELEARADVFSHDALAWALAAAGQPAEAELRIRLALAEGTRDARLLLHAGTIFARSGKVEEASRRLDEARELERMLYPSERERLRLETARLGLGAAPHGAESSAGLPRELKESIDFIKPSGKGEKT